ncbi:unnamed protein product, partial [Linum tenue]
SHSHFSPSSPTPSRRTPRPTAGSWYCSTISPSNPRIPSSSPPSSPVASISISSSPMIPSSPSRDMARFGGALDVSVATECGVDFDEVCAGIV